jgi:hypothetical protein
MAIAYNRGYSIHYSAAGEVTTENVVMKGFAWTGSTNATHTMAMKDGAGNLVYGPFVAGIIGQPIVIMFPEPVQVKGLEVDVLGSGVVDVFL